MSLQLPNSFFDVRSRTDETTTENNPEDFFPYGSPPDEINYDELSNLLVSSQVPKDVLIKTVVTEECRYIRPAANIQPVYYQDNCAVYKIKEKCVKITKKFWIHGIAELLVAVDRLPFENFKFIRICPGKAPDDIGIVYEGPQVYPTPPPVTPGLGEIYEWEPPKELAPFNPQAHVVPYTEGDWKVYIIHVMKREGQYRIDGCIVTAWYKLVKKTTRYRLRSDPLEKHPKDPQYEDMGQLPQKQTWRIPGCQGSLFMASLDPSQYQKPSLADSQLVAYLNGGKSSELGTKNEDGSVHISRRWFKFDGKNFLIPSDASSKTIKNIQSSSLVTLHIHSEFLHQSYLVSGHASIEEFNKKDGIEIFENYLPKTAAKYFLEFNLKERTNVMIKLTPEKLEFSDPKIDYKK